jgi:hypothetical protein
MYLNDDIVNKIPQKSGCGNCGGVLGCNDCPALGQNFMSAGITGASAAANFFLPGAGPIVGGIGGIFSSLFGGGMSKEQKQSGPYLQEAMKRSATDTYFPETEAEMIEFLQFFATPPASPRNKKYPDIPNICGTKWCPGQKEKCSGAGARGCQYILPYQVYKQLGGLYSTANPAYATFGGGEGMMQSQIIPYFRNILSQYQAQQAATISTPGTPAQAVSEVATTVESAVTNYWPLLLIGGLVYFANS